MSSHIPAARLFQAAAGLDLELEDLLHLRNCSECGEVWGIMTRNGAQHSHAGLVQLWQYANGLELEEADYKHLSECERCLAALWIIRSGRSLEDLVQIIRAQ